MFKVMQNTDLKDIRVEFRKVHPVMVKIRYDFYPLELHSLTHDINVLYLHSVGKVTDDYLL